MLLPRLISVVWILVLINGALVPLAIAGESMKRHRTLAIVFKWAPFVFPALCVGVFMFASHLDREHGERLRAQGLEAPAIILEVHDRGIELGVDPVLTVRVRVTPAGAEPFETDVAVVPSRLDMALVRQGTTLRVRYDPSDPSRVAVEAITNAAIP